MTDGDVAGPALDGDVGRVVGVVTWHAARRNAIGIAAGEGRTRILTSTLTVQPGHL